MVEYINSRQEIGSHLDVAMVDKDDINCLSLLIMSYYVHSQFTLVALMNSKQCINSLSSAFFSYELLEQLFL